MNSTIQHDGKPHKLTIRITQQLRKRLRINAAQRETGLEQLCIAFLERAVSEPVEDELAPAPARRRKTA